MSDLTAAESVRRAVRCEPCALRCQLYRGRSSQSLVVRAWRGGIDARSGVHSSCQAVARLLRVVAARVTLPATAAQRVVSVHWSDSVWAWAPRRTQGDGVSISLRRGVDPTLIRVDYARPTLASVHWETPRAVRGLTLRADRSRVCSAHRIGASLGACASCAGCCAHVGHVCSRGRRGVSRSPRCVGSRCPQSR